MLQTIAEWCVDRGRNMRHKIIVFLTMMLDFVLFMNKSYAENVTIGVDTSYAPYMYKEGENILGIYPVLIKKIFDEIGVKYKIVAYPWKRVKKYSEEGKIIGGGFLKTEERLKIYNFSDAIFSEKVSVFVQKEKPFEYEKVSDLSGKKIAVKRGFSYGDSFDKIRKQRLFDVTETSSDKASFSMLKLGRVDAVLTDEEIGKILLKEMGIEDKILKLPNPLSKNKVYLVVKKNSKLLDLIPKINEAIKNL